MSFGKYSPTVNAWYRFDQEWWKKNGGDIFVQDTPHSFLYDKDGYDSYGYDANGVDRAGKTENDYDHCDDVICDGTLYEDVYMSWNHPVPTL